ncbi:ammonia-forming cytochrome c nitrite reductase subunit c552 [Escherichia coli]
MRLARWKPLVNAFKPERFNQQSMVCGQCHVEYYSTAEQRRNFRGMTA